MIDEPTIGVDFAARDSILLLLRSIADEGVGVLMSTGETPCLAGADRALAMSNGRLGGELEPDLAPIVPLRVAAHPAA